MQAKTVRKTLEQGRAEFAYKCVKQVLDFKKFNFGSKSIDKKEIIIGWFNRNLNKEYKYNRIYKEFIENPEGKFHEYSNQLKETKKNNEWKLEDKLKENIIEYYNKYKSEYKSFAKKIPMLIRNNGLGATFAFVNSKAKDGNAYELLYSHTGEWLKNCSCDFINLSHEDNFVAQMISLDSPEYRAVTIEVLAFFNWLRRFAEGLIEGEDEGDGIDE